MEDGANQPNDLQDFDPKSPGLMPFLSHEITSRRNYRGLTIEELADLSGIHRTFLGAVESGKRGISISYAEKIAQGLGCSLSNLITAAETRADKGEYTSSTLERVLSQELFRNEDKLVGLTTLTTSVVRQSIEQVYSTLDLIDNELVKSGVDKISHLVEYANLSSMVGNIAGAGLAEASDGTYTRNRPHAYPDLIPNSKTTAPNLEVKVALESNKPKGHLPKEGVYITYRYVLGSEEGTYMRGKRNRGDTVWIWEVRVGHLVESDFSCSNTEGDSGKTAVITTTAGRGSCPMGLFSS